MKEHDAYYKTKTVLQTEHGLFDYDPEKVKDIVGNPLSYDEYLAIMERSLEHCRHWFQYIMYAAGYCSYKGQIERINKNKVCFKRIYLDCMYMDGTCFEGKEEHVWMDYEPFKGYSEGDSLHFYAEVYRYLKIGHGKLIDYGLRNPKEITKIESYELPSDDDLHRQAVNQLICEVCMFNEHCYGNCIANKEWLSAMRSDLMQYGKEGI